MEEKGTQTHVQMKHNYRGQVNFGGGGGLPSNPFAQQSNFNHGAWAEEMAQCLGYKSWLLFPRILDPIPGTHMEGGSQPFLTPFPGDLMPSPGIFKPTACKWYTDMHAQKICICLKYK